MRRRVPSPALALSFLFVLGASLLGLPGPCHAEGQLDLIFAADLAGRFSPRRCTGPALDGGPGLAALAGAIDLARKKAAAALVIGGNLLGPGNLARFLLASDKGSAAAAQLLSRAGVDVFTPGVSEFAM